MSKWIVTTRAEVRRTYEVEAENEKEAEAATCNLISQYEEEIEEETLAITLVEPNRTK